MQLLSSQWCLSVLEKAQARGISDKLKPYPKPKISRDCPIDSEWALPIQDFPSYSTSAFNIYSRPHGRPSPVKGMFGTEFFLEGSHATYPNLSEAFPIQSRTCVINLVWTHRLLCGEKKKKMVFGRRGQLSIELVEFHPLMNLIVVGSFFFIGW